MSETITKDKEFKDLVHVVREQQVMLDSELAELYGYEVKNFNRQVKSLSRRFWISINHARGSSNFKVQKLHLMFS